MNLQIKYTEVDQCTNQQETNVKLIQQHNNNKLQKIKKMNTEKTQQKQNVPEDELTQDKATAQHQFQCRICLQSHLNEGSASELISPCKCTGSLKFVHNACLEQWIGKIVNKSGKKISSGKANICCEICQSRIFFKTIKRLKCKSKDQILTNFKQNIKTFILLLILLIINLGFFFALLNYLLFTGFTTLKDNNVVLVSLIISGQVIFSIVSMVTLTCIVNKYFINRQFIVFGIKHNNNLGVTNNQEEIGENSQMQIMGKNKNIKKENYINCNNNNKENVVNEIKSQVNENLNNDNNNNQNQQRVNENVV